MNRTEYNAKLAALRLDYPYPMYRTPQLEAIAASLGILPPADVVADNKAIEAEYKADDINGDC